MAGRMSVPCMPVVRGAILNGYVRGDRNRVLVIDGYLRVQDQGELLCGSVIAGSGLVVCGV